MLHLAILNREECDLMPGSASIGMLQRTSVFHTNARHHAFYGKCPKSRATSEAESK